MRRPNIVFCTVESTRADHTSFLGERDTTPELERIAALPDGHWSSNCFANSMKTPASSASLLTGTYPATHGVGMGPDGSEQLPGDLVTLPELLGEAGYRTACVSTNAYLSPANGLDRGFHDFSWLKTGKSNFLPTHKHFRSFLKYARRLGTYGPGLDADGRKHNLTYAQVDIIKRWIKDAAGGEQPFFCYAHVQNPHLPYTPPRKYRDAFLDETNLSPDEALQLSLELFSSNAEKKRRIANGLELSDAEMAALQGLYDAEIAYTDELLGDLFDYVNAVTDETVFVVTADHGELFGEYGLVGHNLVLHDALINVPLVLHGLSPIEPETGQLVQHVDLTRTLAEEAGCSDDQFEGIDIRTDTREWIVSQRGFDNLEAYTKHNPAFDTSRFQEECLNCVRTETIKYLQGIETRELYWLPDETTNVLDAYPAVAESLSAVVRDVGDCCDVGESKRAEFTPEMEEQLGDLGYL